MDAREQVRSAETWQATVSELAGTLVVTAVVCLTIVNTPDTGDGWQHSVRRNARPQRFSDRADASAVVGWTVGCSQLPAVTLVGIVGSAATYAAAAGLAPRGALMLNPALALGVFVAGHLNWLRYGRPGWAQFLLHGRDMYSSCRQLVRSLARRAARCCTWWPRCWARLPAPASRTAWRPRASAMVCRSAWSCSRVCPPARHSATRRSLPLSPSPQCWAS